MSVYLTVTDINGCSETSMQFLTIAQPPIANFTYNSIICDSIQFTNTSTSAPGYNIVESHWNFGDGSPTVIAQDTSHQYPHNTTPGGEVYNVSLLIFADSSGFVCTDSVVIPVTVPPLPDIFYTFSPDPTCYGDTTHFYGESGYYINTWNWDFGDGNTSLSQYSTNLYADTGSYTVTLGITDTLGCANTLSKVVRVNPVPEVSFTMSDSVTCHGNGITFIGTASSNVAVWYWEFGDGSYSYNQNPYHYYSNSGTYQVTLTVTDTAGCSSTAGNEVLILPSPTADYTYTPVTCSSMLFSDQSIAPTGYTIVEWQWDFGDGTTATVQNPSHSYGTGGAYDVTLIVRADSTTSSYSCYDTIVQTVVMPGAPSVYFTWNPEPTMLGDATNFNGTSGSNITDWYWDFNDGNFATTQNASNIFAAIGTYNVELTVTDINGCTNSIIHQVTVTNVPELDYSWGTSCEGSAVQFTIESPPTDIPAVVSWSWDFGDGGVSSDMEPIHTYNVANTYNVSLTIIDTMGATNTVIKPITINPLPVSLFSIDAPSCSSSPVQFHNLSTTPTGFITEWLWDFGDGNTTTVTFPDDPDVTHVYTTTGTYIVTLTITNSDSCSNSSSNTVTTIPGPTAMFTHDSGCASGPVTFTDTSIENGGGAIVSWNWNFDDLASGPGNTSTLQNPVHLFSASGDYNVELIVSNINGCTDTTITVVTVADAPTVEFAYSSACLGSETQFTVDEVITNVGNVQTWMWSFGDGSTSNLQNPTHIYAATGNYTVLLSIVTTDGCTASVSHVVPISPLPNPNFESTTPACLNDTVYFTDLSSSPNGLITTWHWDFGDGTQVTINAPDNPDVSHLYTNNAIFAVTLTVTDGDTCENTIVKQVEIVSSPIADYSYTETCYNEPVYFTDLSTTNGGTDIYSWEWFFGDPNSGIENHSNLQNPTHLYTEPGIYDATLIILSTTGCTDTTVQEITIDSLPNVDFTMLNDSICLGEPAEFTGISSSDISSWSWDFGDGGYSIEQNPTYMYSASGTYIVTLTVTEIGPDGCQNSISHTIYVNDAPQTDFDYQNTCQGDSTYFTDLSYSQNGFIVGWQWDFGDGSTSIEQDPIHYYLNNDSYVVTLISTDNYGCSDTLSQWIQVYSTPISNFTYNQQCDPTGAVNFFDESQVGADGSPIESWNWNLYNGYYSTEIDPSYIYPQTDTCYTVILEITDGNGCISTDTNTQVCLYGTLNIDYTSSEECLGTPTFFTASYTPASDSVASYTWNFNDGSQNEVTYHDTISHTFTTPGLFIVELTALDTNGCSMSTYHEVVIDSLPTPQFSNTTGSCNTATQFTDESLGGGEFIDTWSWDFGDISSPNNTSNLQNPSHLYGPYDSTYQVKLTVTNFNGCTDSIIQDVYVEPCLIADFTLPTQPLCARYNNICFSDISQLSSNNGSITQWRWDFGDGQSYNYGTYQDSICHSYADGGDYNVQLIIEAVINSITYNDTIEHQLTVHPTPEAGIIVSNNCLGDSTIFTDNTITNAEPLTMWYWNFGDNTTLGDTSLQQNPTYMYPNYNTYSVELKVMNQYSCKDSITTEVEIYKPPQAAFSYSETCMSYNTYFTDESIGDSSTINQYLWNFGDTLTQATSTEQNPYYVYDSTGIYNVLLQVSDGNQCHDTISNTITIYPIPTSRFVIFDTVQQGNIYLDNTSIAGTSYYWDFDYDNMVNSTEKSPMHQYEIDGSYNIMLVTYNDYGCPDTTYQIYDLLFTNLFVPNAFLPSGGNVELQTFKPTGINIKRYHIEIYSTWGNLVFESTKLTDGAPAEGWDGTYKGEPLPTGSFIWRITAEFEDGTYWQGSDNGDGNTQTNGTVTLIR
jgi:PKD repeat protein